MDFTYNILTGDGSLNVEQNCIKKSISKKMAYTIISPTGVDMMASQLDLQRGTPNVKLSKTYCSRNTGNEV